MTKNPGFDVELPLALSDAAGRVKDALKVARGASERMALAATG